MASFFGILHRPLPAAAAFAAAAVLPDCFHRQNPREPNAESSPTSLEQSPLPLRIFEDGNCPFPKSGLPRKPGSLFGSFSSSLSSSPTLLAPYQYAKLAKPTRDPEFTRPLLPSAPSEVLYCWHLPDPRAYWESGRSACSAAKCQTVVVLLGWLGAKQKHLKRYAEWYTKRGFHVVTFTFPMADIIGYKSRGRAEQDIEMLASHLAGWVEEESQKNLVFHTFSNTGWLTYGVILEKFRNQDPSLMENIKGCIVDSAPVAAPDPQVWASGFSAAFLKKQSVAAKCSLSSSGSGIVLTAATNSDTEPKPVAAEAVLLVVLKKFFEVVLNLPTINRRLTDVLGLLSSEQPKCPQLYIYSSADRVIPARSVESFVDQQRRVGYEVRACDFGNSPHVDHFRNHPALYTSQLTDFLEDCVLTCCKDSS